MSHNSAYNAAIVRRWKQAVEVYIREVEGMLDKSERLGRLPESLEKYRLAEEMLRDIEDEADSVRSASQAVAKACVDCGVDPTAIAELIELPCEVSKPAVLRRASLAVESLLARAGKRPAAAKAAARRNPSRPPLGGNAGKIYEILLTLPEHKGMTGSQLVTWLWEKHQINTSDSVFYKHIVPELRRYGVKNARRIGYYLPLAARSPK